MHPFGGNWKHFRDCDIGSDWLLIYRVDGDDLNLVRTGTYSDCSGGVSPPVKKPGGHIQQFTGMVVSGACSERFLLVGPASWVWTGAEFWSKRRCNCRPGLRCQKTEEGIAGRIATIAVHP